MDCNELNPMKFTEIFRIASSNKQISSLNMKAPLWVHANESDLETPRCGHHGLVETKKGEHRCTLYQFNKQMESR